MRSPASDAAGALASNACAASQMVPGELDCRQAARRRPGGECRTRHREQQLTRLHVDDGQHLVRTSEVEPDQLAVRGFERSERFARPPAARPRRDRLRDEIAQHRPGAPVDAERRVSRRGRDVVNHPLKPVELVGGQILENDRAAGSRGLGRNLDLPREQRVGNQTTNLVEGVGRTSSGQQLPCQLGKQGGKTLFVHGRLPCAGPAHCRESIASIDARKIYSTVLAPATRNDGPRDGYFLAPEQAGREMVVDIRTNVAVFLNLLGAF